MDAVNNLGSSADSSTIITPLNALDPNASLPARPPILLSDHAVSILGVPIEFGSATTRVPQWERFSRNTLTDYDLRLMQAVAIAIDLNQPLLIEGGSGLGKSQTVERVCSLAKRACFYANCHDFTAEVLIGSMSIRDDTKSGYGWVDGVVVQAIREGGVLFLDEYNFMRGDTRGRLHEILDSILRGKDEIVLVENGAEIVPVHRDFRIVAAQNPPGAPFLDREILDPAQITRFLYLKQPADLPDDVKQARALGAFGYKRQSSLVPVDWLSTANSQQLGSVSATRGDLIDVAKHFIEAHANIERAIAAGEIGSEQPQPLHLSLDRDRKRIFAFMLRYFDDTLAKSLNKALRYYMTSLFENSRDKSRVSQIIANAIK